MRHRKHNAVLCQAILYRHIFHTRTTHFDSYPIIFIHDGSYVSRHRIVSRGDLYLRIYFNINLCAAPAITVIRTSRQTDVSCADILSNICACNKSDKCNLPFYYVTGYLLGINICRAAGILRDALFFNDPSAYTCESLNVRLTC